VHADYAHERCRYSARTSRLMSDSTATLIDRPSCTIR
jgi:hypothetical protein